MPITVWGGVSDNKLLPLFRAQKKCLRILFGDKEAFLDKFKTCARTRPFGEQKLDKEFFEREHTKPLFTNNKLLTVHNLYFYHCTTSIFKVMKYFTPTSIHAIIKPLFSKLQETRFNPQTPDNNYFYKATKLWNRARQHIGIETLDQSISLFKSSMKSFIHEKQKCNDTSEWTPENFQNAC